MCATARGGGNRMIMAEALLAHNGLQTENSEQC
jgi:hypothetical protein